MNNSTTVRLREEIESITLDIIRASQDRDLDEVKRLVKKKSELEAIIGRAGTSLNGPLTKANQSISLNDPLNDGRRSAKNKPPGRPSHMKTRSKEQSESISLNNGRRYAKIKPSHRPSVMRTRSNQRSANNMRHSNNGNVSLNNVNYPVHNFIPKTVKKLLEQKENWNSQNSTRKEIQREYNRQKQEIEDKRRSLMATTPHVIDNSHISDYSLATMVKNENRNAMGEKVVEVSSYDSEYKKFQRIIQNLKSYMNKQSEYLKRLKIATIRCRDNFNSQTEEFDREKNRHIVDIFDRDSTYQHIARNLKNLTNDEKGKLRQYYDVMRSPTDIYIKAFIRYIEEYLKFPIAMLLWGFCLSDIIQTNEQSLQYYNDIIHSFDNLQYNIQEYSRRYNDATYDITSIRGIDKLQRIIAIKLNGKKKWNGSNLTVPEIYRYLMEDTISMTSIEDLKDYLDQKTYKFPYNELTDLESEIIKSILLFKIKQNQPGTIKIDDDMVEPITFVRGVPIPPGEYY